MTRVAIDANVQKLFLNFTKPLELCDESGFLCASTPLRETTAEPPQ
jgi:hypothetical protein